jgi:ubiquinone/menaquinone biosynthesis C-methylase UbiE
VEFERLRTQAALMQVELPFYEQLGLTPGSRVLDVGAGSGEPARILAVQGMHVTCVDRDPELLERAHGDFEVVLGNATELPFEDGSFDVAFSRLAFQHFLRPALALREMRRVVRPGGLILITDTDHESGCVYPRLAPLEAAWSGWIARARSMGADPTVGRRLRALLRNEGLEDVHTHVLPLDSQNVGIERAAEILFGPPTALLRGEALATARAAVTEWTTTPGAFAVALLMIAGARVPMAPNSEA